MSFKTFIIKLVCFAALFFFADFFIGYVFRYLESHAGDKFARENYMRYEMTADVIIMGSSKAAHHYVPDIIEKGLGMSAYNCGQRGNGIVYEYGRLATIYKRYTPKIIIVDVYKGFDLEVNDNSRYLDFLKMDYGHNATVDSMFLQVDKWSKYKMFLQSYRYNSLLCDLIINTVNKNRQRFRENGYYPLCGSKINNNMIDLTQPIPKLQKIDSLKLYYLEKTAYEQKKDSKLIFVISPTLLKIEEHDYDIVREICKKNNIPLLEYINDEKFCGKIELFYDSNHLNDTGAVVFSNLLVSDIKKMLNDTTFHY